MTNSDCDRTKACLNNKCKDPCPGTCGLNAECKVVNHAPSCSCLPGYVGDPISACHLVPSSKHVLLYNRRLAAENIAVSKTCKFFRKKSNRILQVT